LISMPPTGSVDRLKLLVVCDPAIVSFASTVPLLFLMLRVVPQWSRYPPK
jgi:hypothetical protein